MVSNTRITKTVRRRKKATVGTKRKARNRNKGSTPKFSIHEK